MPKIGCLYLKKVKGPHKYNENSEYSENNRNDNNNKSIYGKITNLN